MERQLPRGIICYPKQMNSLCPNPSHQAGTQFTNPGRMDGWAGL